MTIERNTNYERYEDMSAEGKLWMLLEDSGDIIITIVPDSDGPRRAFSSIQFCTISNGGGQSPAVLEALYALMQAIETDNRNHPQSRQE